MQKGPLKLNLGCGTHILPGWINIDSAALPGVNLVHDLNVLPLPYADASVDEIFAENIFEHLDYIPLLRECHRLLIPGGRLRLEVPHFTSVNNFADPTHRNRFSIRTFNFFCGATYEGSLDRGYYFDFKFSKIAERRIRFYKRSIYAFNSLIEGLVNQSLSMQMFYEATGFSRLFPAMNIRLTLVK